MFIPALAAAESEEGQVSGDEMGHSGHCWCNCTLTETGPDDRPVGFQVCTHERTCFEQ
jgi:hypothetical protein